MEGLYAWVGRHAQLLRKVYDKNNRITPFVLFENWLQIYYWILWLAGVWWVWVVGSLWAWGRKDCLARWWEEDDKPYEVGMGFNW